MRDAGVTLQVNLSAGDLDYAPLTVPALAAAHRRGIAERLLVVDCCRPQRTQLVDPDARHPEPAFSARVAAVCRLAESFRARGLFDRVEYVRPDDARLAERLRRYIGPFVRETHDCWGAGLAAYVWAWAETRTRGLLHYDADVLLHQEPGFDWAEEARRRLAAEPRALAATPRVSPPSATGGSADAPSRHRSPVRVEARGDVWHVGWFSTRCFLLDLTRLDAWLPLLTWRNPAHLAEVLLRRVTGRSYPPSPELLIHRRALRRGAVRLDLMSSRAFLLHPADKGARFLALLPALVDAVRAGRVPDAQRGWENVDLDAWEAWLAGDGREARGRVASVAT